MRLMLAAFVLASFLAASASFASAQNAPFPSQGGGGNYPQQQQGGFPQQGGGQGNDQGNGQQYQDPNGRFRMSIPPGWNMSSDNGNVTLSSGPGTVQIILSSAQDATAAANNVAAAYKAGFARYNLLNQGDTTIANHPARGINIDGVTAKGEHIAVLIMAQSAGNGHFLITLSTVPANQSKQFTAGVMALANSVRFQGE